MNRKISDELDYGLRLTDDRMNLVENLIQENDEKLVDYYSNHYNPHLSQRSATSEFSRVSKDLEQLANYLLYSKDGDANSDTITEYKEKRNSQREASINNILKVRESRRETNRSIIKYPRIKVTKKDRKKYKELGETGKAIENLSEMINSGENSRGEKLSPSEIRRLKWIRTDIQKDEIVVKNQLKKYIRFQSVTDVEEDRNALSYIRFDDPEIIRLLIEDYSELKENSYDDTFGYMKVILLTLEELVDMSGMDEHLVDILIYKAERRSQEEIISMLKDKHGMDMKKPTLSETTRRVIPNIIVDTYKQVKEDWVYTYIFKGEYKTCTSCKQNKLATVKYYSPHKISRSGLQSQCKICRRNKYNRPVKSKR